MVLQVGVAMSCDYILHGLPRSLYDEDDEDKDEEDDKDRDDDYDHQLDVSSQSFLHFHIPTSSFSLLPALLLFLPHSTVSHSTRHGLFHWCDL